MLNTFSRTELLPAGTPWSALPRPGWRISTRPVSTLWRGSCAGSWKNGTSGNERPSIPRSSLFALLRTWPSAAGRTASALPAPSATVPTAGTVISRRTPPHDSVPGTCGGAIQFGVDVLAYDFVCAKQMLFSSLTAAAAGCCVDSTMQTLRSGTVSVRSMRYMECPQSSSDGKDAGTKPIPKFAFTMGSI